MSSRSYYVGVQFWPSYHDDDLDDNDGDDDDKRQVHSQPHQVDISRDQRHKGSQLNIDRLTSRASLKSKRKLEVI